VLCVNARSIDCCSRRLSFGASPSSWAVEIPYRQPWPVRTVRPDIERATSLSIGHQPGVASYHGATRVQRRPDHHGSAVPGVSRTGIQERGNNAKRKLKLRYSFKINPTTGIQERGNNAKRKLKRGDVVIPVHSKMPMPVPVYYVTTDTFVAVPGIRRITA
jgi:hypothetical protein